MNLHPDWKHILRRAWSVRLMVLAGLLSAVEVALPFFENSIPRGLFAAVSGLVVGAAFVARLIAQKQGDAE